MKIGILTYHRSVNYGAFLQAWSLAALLRCHGAQVEMIDYQPAHRWKRALRLNFRRPLSAANFMALRRHWLFRDYINKKLPLGRLRFKTYGDLESARWDLDAIVCGSDQIWNPQHIGHLDPAYFAWFAPPGVRRVAYAASAGMESMPAAFVEDYRKYVKRMDYIGVREGAFAEFTAGLVGRPCQHVLDPTLLGVDFSVIEEPVSTPSRYLLSYALQLTPTMKNTIRSTANAMGIPALTIKIKAGAHEYARYHRTPGPGQWLTLIKHAEMVATNSFHGVAFCLVYRRPFVVVPSEGEGSVLMARITDLLKQVNLSHLVRSQDNGFADAHQLGANIDWNSVHKRLNDMRCSSLSYLANALTMPELAMGGPKSQSEN
jgi:hypothetical protein